MPHLSSQPTPLGGLPPFNWEAIQLLIFYLLGLHHCITRRAYYIHKEAAVKIWLGGKILCAVVFDPRRGALYVGYLCGERYAVCEAY